MRDQDETAGIPLPPPLIPVGLLLLGAVIQAIVPFSYSGLARVRWLGWIPLGLGIFLIAAAFRAMSRAETPVDPGEPVRALVFSGPFQYTRNPIYTGFLFTYLGLSIVVGLWISLLIFPLVPILLTWVVITREEAYLARRFGDEYNQYRRRVRRWGIV